MYAGLGDGTVAVFNPCNASNGHTHLILVCSSPILSCVSVGGRLFASSRNTLYQLTPGKAEVKVSGWEKEREGGGRRGKEEGG